ncbi:MAG: peptidylprolyl isomerase [Dehalococcoidia bacterium]
MSFLPRAARLITTGFAVVAVALALVACSGGDDDDAPSPTQRPSSPPSATAPSGAAPANPTPAAASAPGTCTGPGIASIQRDNVRKYSAYPETVIDPAKTYIAVVKTSKGDITMNLAAAQAPKTVNSFVFLSCHGFYDGLTFHRVVANFVIQGGDPNGNGTGGPGYTFGLEISDLKHDTVGTLAMARSQDPNSNGSQWYITTAVNSQTTNLDGQYTVFGKVTSGMDVVLAIRQGDKINSVSITEQ